MDGKKEGGGYLDVCLRGEDGRSGEWAIEEKEQWGGEGRGDLIERRGRVRARGGKIRFSRLIENVKREGVWRRVKLSRKTMSTMVVFVSLFCLLVSLFLSFVARFGVFFLSYPPRQIVGVGNESWNRCLGSWRMGPRQREIVGIVWAMAPREPSWLDVLFVDEYIPPRTSWELFLRFHWTRKRDEDFSLFG